MKSRSAEEVAVLAEACLRLLELHVNQADESKETDVVNVEDVYNELKPQLEALIRRREDNEAPTQLPKPKKP